MNIRTTIAALAFCLASTVTFAATPTSPAAYPTGSSSPGSKSAAVHCSKGHVLQDGKCVARNKTKPKN